jgi:putative glutamine amidotransferase
MIIPAHNKGGGMKSLILKKILAFACLCSLAFAATIPARAANEWSSDLAIQGEEKVKLAIFRPVEVHIKILEELGKQGFLDINNLKVTGFYHKKELTDFNKVKMYIQKNNIDWMQIHEISGELSIDTLFKKNGCTADFKYIFNNFDGVVFFGGHDIQPQIYGQKTSLLTQIQTPYRHLLALSAVFHLLGGFQDKDHSAFLEENREFPVLGICLGCQTLNVGTGGTMIQDIWADGYHKKFLEDVAAIPIELLHRNPYAQLYPEKKITMWQMHPIKIVKEGKFCSELGFSPDDKIVVSSAHHQMLGELGKDMKTIATSLDGKVIEAIEHERFSNVLGVQFHPELYWLWDKKAKFRFSPKCEGEKSFATILEENPPSYEFHKKLWLWFSRKLKETHQNRKHH